MYERMNNPINIPNSSPSCNFHYHGETIHATEIFISMTLFKILGILTWAQLFLNSKVSKDLRGVNTGFLGWDKAYGMGIIYTSLIDIGLPYSKMITPNDIYIELHLNV